MWKGFNSNLKIVILFACLNLCGLDETRVSLDAPQRCLILLSLLLSRRRMLPYSFTLWKRFLARDSSSAHKWQLAYLHKNKYGPAHGSFTWSSLSLVIRKLQILRPIKYFQSTFNNVLTAALHISWSPWQDWFYYHSHCWQPFPPYVTVMQQQLFTIINNY